MKTEKLIDAIGMVGDDLIMDAKQQKVKFHWRRVVAAAACLVLVAGSVLLLLLQPGGISPHAAAAQIYDRSPEQGYLGNYDAFSSNSLLLEPNWHGVSVTARAVETLPGTYLFIGDSRKTPLRLVRMETLKTLHGRNMVDEFYFLLPEKFATDLTRYDALILDNLCQYSYENHVLFNQTAGCYEAAPLVLFGTFQSFNLYNGIYAFSNGYFDESLWTANAAWAENFSSALKRLDTAADYDIVRRGWTLLQSEMKIWQRYADYDSQQGVGSLAAANTPAEKEALEYINPFQNGIFIRELSFFTISDKNIWGNFRRYINGYPTNETVRIMSDEVIYSNATFTQEDLSRLPDLALALYAVGNAFNAGEITPPHITDWQNRKLWDYAVIGWYAKTANGVYGIIRVDWKFQGEENWRSYYDDCYFIVNPGQAEAVPISRDDLLAVLDLETDFVYTGEYDSLGKTNTWNLIPPPT